MCKRAICLISVLLLAGSAIVSAATPGPVGWWKFDETSGAIAADSVAGNNGTLLPADPNGKGLGPKWVAGQFGGALQFNGVDNYVDLPIGSLISTLSDTTVATWANFSNAGGAWQRIFDFGSGTGIYMFLCPRVNTSGTIRFAIRTAAVGEQVVNSPATLPSGWHHVAVVIDSATKIIKLYQDGVLVGSGATTLLPKDMGKTTQNWLGKSQWPDALYLGSLDEFRIYDRALSQDEVANAMQGGMGYGVAVAVSPADKATDLVRDQVLSWTAGQVAKTHDVYFGAVRDDVANATTAKPLGVLVSPGQTTTTYKAGRLEFGKTYYWRVDEVGAAPGFTATKGNVWSFTVESFSSPIAKSNITATASSSNSADMGPQKTVDGSGLNANDQHSTKETDMWLSAKGGAQPTWIQYAFDKIYSLDKVLVWNSNQALESIVGYGAKSVTVEYGVDPNKLTKLGVFEFAEATGDPTYTANTTVTFGGVAAKFVKLTISSNWGGVLAQYGLSEVRFSYIPAMAKLPSPAPGTANLYPVVTLSWQAGRDAASHEVYLSTDQQAVIGSTALVAKVSVPSYTPAIELARTYYWKIVEVNTVKGPTGWPSDIWSFSTQEYIQAYTFKNAADRTVTYGNERTFTPVQDWTVGGAKTLVATFKGAPGNAAGHLYLDVSGMNGAYWTRVYYSDVLDLTRQVLQQLNIDFSSLGINWKSIQGLRIGVVSGGTGTITLDDLRLYRAAPAVVSAVDPAGKGGLAALYAMENNADDTSGKGLNGKMVNGPTFVDSFTGLGKAMSFDGVSNYVDLPIGTLLSTLSDITIATWANYSGTGGAWQRMFDLGSGTSTYLFLTPNMASNQMRVALRTATVGEQIVTDGALPTGWHHVAVVIDSATKTMKLYLDGTVVASGATTLLPKDMGVTTQNWLARSQYPADAYYKGALDDFRIYSRPLSEGEIRYLAGDR